ncbi:MAG: hypothetical protein ACK4TP_00330 [Hyphomicrobium sp.]
MARRSIGEAAKVVIAALLLGPPLGGIVVIGLLQLVPWMATDFAVPLPEFGKNLVSALLLAIPLSYAVGAYSAILAGLALAAYVAWGGRLTWWACLGASLVYPALLAVSGWVATRDAPETVSPVMINAAIIAIASASGALLTYLLLRRTALVRRLNAPADA